jgi:hypothetical protein
MILAEAGYEKETHDTGVAKIKAMKPNIEQAIRELVKLYHSLYEVDAYNINCGMCEDFSADVIAILADGKESEELCAVWHDNMTDCTQAEENHWAHNFVIYEGRFYDSQSPEGVDDWRNIPAFANNPV